LCVEAEDHHLQVDADLRCRQARHPGAAMVSNRSATSACSSGVSKADHRLRHAQQARVAHLQDLVHGHAALTPGSSSTRHAQFARLVELAAGFLAGHHVVGLLRHRAATLPPAASISALACVAARVGSVPVSTRVLPASGCGASAAAAPSCSAR
jgi:hypothetical protein